MSFKREILMESKFCFEVKCANTLVFITCDFFRHCIEIHTRNCLERSAAYNYVYLPKTECLGKFPVLITFLLM